MVSTPFPAGAPTDPFLQSFDNFRLKTAWVQTPDTGYSRQNAKRIAAALHDAGYVVIMRDKNDARALRVELTAKCIEYFKTGQTKNRFLEKIFTGFDAELTHNVY